MLTQFIALLSVCTCPNQDAPTAKVLIEKMLARYHAAKTLTGQVKLTVSAEGGSATLNTTIQYERPNKLYLFQQKSSGTPDAESPSKWLVTSDGRIFSYNVPNEKFLAAPGVRLVEPVSNPRAKIEHTIATIYGAAGKSLGDRSTPLDIAIGGRGDLVYRIGQWATREVIGTKEIGGKTVYLVGGQYRPYAGSEVIGKYQMALTPDGDLLQYVDEQVVGVEGRNPVKVHSQWDVQFTVDGKVDPALFKVITR